MPSIHLNYISKSWKIHKRFISRTTQIISKENLTAPAYQPSFVEKKKYEKWERSGLFEAQNDCNKPIFSMILPPPNVTGKLHLGHALACTIQDVIARRKRSQGYNVLWLPGIDHAGIATQGVVERHLQNTQNISREEIGREKFIEQVWKWKEKHGNTICDQLRMLGCSLDWSRQYFTMNPLHCSAVNTAFIHLFKNGLIYRRKALVNWCPKLKSTISDIEIENVHIKKPTEMKLPSYDKPVKFGLLYSFAYKLVDGTKGNEEIVVATTMPETMLGDTAIAVHPDDKRYKNLIGRLVYHPFRKCAIPIIGDEFVDMKLGTGAVKITPAHSKIDFEVGERHKLPVVQVINEEGCMHKCDHMFLRMNRYECRERIIKALKDMRLLKGTDPHEMTLPTCSRTGDVICYLPKEQWFLSCSEMNQKAIEAVKSGQLNILPEKFVKNFLKWAEDDRDWCISRQLWWGHQVPAYHCSVGEDVVWIATTNVNVARMEAAKVLRAMPADINAVRDTDVLDTWFSSGIYPFAALGWPEESDLRMFYPLSLMATAHDILGFWVHRMVILGLELSDTLPFNNVLLHGIICDSKGTKMSKSKGNVIDPVDVVKGISLSKLKEKAEEMNKQGVLSKEELTKALEYHKSNFSATQGIPECGVDALRFTLLSQDIKSHFVNFDVYQCNANKLFCNKIWQSVRYTQLCLDKLTKLDGDLTRNDLTFFDKWILSRLSNMVEKVNNALDKYDFHLATKAIKTLMYNEFCDIYVEATKPGFAVDNPKRGYAHAHTLIAVLNTALRCLNPFMIYLTEEIIPKMPAFETNIIHNFDDAYKTFLDHPKTEDFEIWKDESLEKQTDKLLRTLTLVREIKGLYGISNKVRPSIIVETKDTNLAYDLELNRAVVLNLTRCGVLQFGEGQKEKYVQVPLDKDTKVSVEIIGDNVNTTISSAKAKLEKKIKKLEETLTKLEEKLSNTHYLTSVPEWTQVMDREQMENKKEELNHLKKLFPS